MTSVRTSKSWLSRCTVLAIATLATSHLVALNATAAVIPVTTNDQKISSSGGCSLQEAIFSANFDRNVAIVRYNGSTPVEIVTSCQPGSGDDVIVLPAGETFTLNQVVDDALNPIGPTATPIITSNITILGYGATLQRTGTASFRLFAIGDTGHLTLRRVYVKGFRATGGNGHDGGGGGMGAGGAIYVKRGGLVIDGSTFAGNRAVGGLGGTGLSGGGGGMGGHGGYGFGTFDPWSLSGGGGGGARGDGGTSLDHDFGGGGGGTLRSAVGTFGGFDCGADGFHLGRISPCAGGGGFGAIGNESGFFPLGIDGGKGGYGGGGGGGNFAGGGHGGDGGFGGGGGASGDAGFFGEDGGDGGFGGGGGAGNSGGAAGGDPGDGGFFAGNASSTGGGGGAGLGGAIFNDSGTVEIRNSTFTGNVVGGGVSRSTQDGSGGGGAIFSRNGHLTIVNGTISGNLANFGGGIIVAQDSSDAPTSFILQNTIVADNGQYECAITGPSIAAAFTSNLIQSNALDGGKYHRQRFVGCQGVVATGDPQLGPLAYNGGVTPTMAISTTSPAWNAADPSSSSSSDQRRQRRPAMGGFDIGAFELCLEGVGRFLQHCVILVGVERDPEESRQSVDLTMQIAPADGGSTTPPAGTQTVPEGSVIAVNALPNPGFRFVGWSTNVTEPANPTSTVVMDAPHIVTATFEGCACATDVTKSIAIKAGNITFNATTGRYVQSVTLKNISTATIVGPISLVLDELTPIVTLYNAAGATSLMLPAGSPYKNATTSLLPGQNLSITLQFVNPSKAPVSYQARVLAGAGAR